MRTFLSEYEKYIKKEKLYYISMTEAGIVEGMAENGSGLIKITNSNGYQFGLYIGMSDEYIIIEQNSRRIIVPKNTITGIEDYSDTIVTPCPQCKYDNYSFNQRNILKCKKCNYELENEK